jgi:REP-associated tyrosine transposase
VSNYRRNFIQGGSFFFTVSLAARHSRLLVERIELLQQAFRYTQSRHRFTIDALVVLPDHLHAIWTLPSGDADYATRWRLIKTVVSRGVERLEERSESRRLKRERGIWQRRYWEHTLRNEDDFERHCDYIHFNPVKHGYVKSVSDWRFSSFQKFVRNGLYPADWAGVIGTDQCDFGERRTR